MIRRLHRSVKFAWQSELHATGSPYP
jgi:hypothetical protein